MAFIFRPLTELITGEIVIFDNIIYNYFAVGIIAIVAYVIAWGVTGSFIRNFDVTNSKILSLIHWAIRIVIIIVLSIIISWLVRAIIFITSMPLSIWIVISIALLTTAITAMILHGKKVTQ